MTDERVLSSSPRGGTKRVQLRCPDCGIWFVATVRYGIVERHECRDCIIHELGEPITFDALQIGDGVVFSDRKEPLVVHDIESDVREEVGSIQVIDRAHLSGPRGGTVILERTSSGRLRARIGRPSNPALTIRDLRRVRCAPKTPNNEPYNSQVER